MTFNELRCKEVVNMSDGKRLGKVIDLSFDFKTGCVLGITVPDGKVSLFKCGDLFIKLNKIIKIGDDVVLVKLEDEHKHPEHGPGHHHGHHLGPPPPLRPGEGTPFGRDDRFDDHCE